ncbi:hypothetical protein KIN20_023291 [Parelaphostrongylus tenuis]|uniref:Uncharacterized protein n=1 Tax=Parelaphostrongylus tenuis TaxID=148309 RepID=A0AAD5MWN2_PARTN|nr:hypothetical protein KIN20_023291 [Parelaphostrongylus tenuis]
MSGQVGLPTCRAGKVGAGSETRMVKDVQSDIDETDRDLDIGDRAANIRAVALNV